MKYRITYISNFKEKYYKFNSDKIMCEHEYIDSYVVDKIDLCKIILKDLLDISNAPMTEDDVKKHFEYHSKDHKLSKKEIKGILDYYNGRLDIFNDIISEFDSKKNDIKKLKKDESITIFRDIPVKYNLFTLKDENITKQLYCRISINCYK